MVILPTDHDILLKIEVLFGKTETVYSCPDFCWEQIYICAGAVI